VKDVPCIYHDRCPLDSLNRAYVEVDRIVKSKLRAWNVAKRKGRPPELQDVSNFGLPQALRVLIHGHTAQIQHSITF